MTLPEIRKVEKLLDGYTGSFENSVGGDRIVELQRKNDEAAIDLQGRLLRFHQILTSDPRLDGKLTLSVKKLEIGWTNLSQAVGPCFRPEFDYQGDEITAFYIHTKDFRNTSLKEVMIELAMERNGQSWSRVNAGAIVRDPEEHVYAGRFGAYCISPQGQPKDARKAMTMIQEGLWDARAISTPELPLIRSLGNLGEAELLLQFAVRTLDRRLTRAAK